MFDEPTITLFIMPNSMVNTHVIDPMNKTNICIKEAHGCTLDFHDGKIALPKSINNHCSS